MPPATSVTVTPTTAAVYRGETVQFAALVSGPSNKTVTWSVPSGLGSIDSTALYTASSDFGGGAIDVPATSNAVPRTSGTASAADNWRSQEREDNHPTLRSTLHQAGGHTSGPLAKVVLPKYAYLPNPSTSTVSAFLVDADSGALSPVPGSPFAAGAGPISVAVHPTGRFLYVADLDSFQISAYNIRFKTGALTEIPGSPFPAGQNPEFLAVDPAGRFLYALDTFFSPDQNGQIEVFSIDPHTGAITQVPESPFPAGLLPASIAFARAGQLAYVADIASDQVLGYSVDKLTGALTPLPGPPLATGPFPDSVAIDKVTSSLYTAVEGSNAIVGCHIDRDGALGPLPGSPFPTGGLVPLSVTVDPVRPFAYAVNSPSTNVSAFAIDPQSGALSSVQGSPFPTGGAPTAALVDPSGKFLYVVNSGTEDVSVYRIRNNGALKEIPQSPFATRGATAIAITRSHR
jgi:6-phosphogluconolactonase (cycloisomerase 2 family)